MFESVAAAVDHALSEEVNERLSMSYETSVIEEVTHEPSVVQVHYSCTQPGNQPVNQKVEGMCVSMVTHLRATERHLPYGITQCHLPPDTGEHAPP